MIYHYQNTGMIALPFTGFWSASGNVTGVLLNNFNPSGALQSTPLATLSQQTTFVSTSTGVFLTAVSRPFMSGQTVTGSFTGCIGIWATAAEAGFNSNVAVVIRAVSADSATTGHLNTLFTGIIGRLDTNNNIITFTGNYTAATINTANFRIVHEFGFVDGYSSRAGIVNLVVGDPLTGRPMRSGAEINNVNYPWFIDTTFLKDAVLMSGYSGYSARVLTGIQYQAVDQV